MKLKTGPKARLVYYAIRFAAFGMQMFPIDMNLRTARWVGRLLWRVDGRHRERAREHLRAAYPGQLNDGELDDLSRRCFEHWAMYAVEFFCAFRLLNEWSWPRYLRLENLEEAVRVLLEKKGALLLTGHYGNFELTAYMLAAVGFEAAALMRPLDNKYLNDFVVRTRAAQGLRLLTKSGAMNEAVDIIERGGALGLVADQDAGRKGVYVDFFGRSASTYKSIALLAMQSEVPIVVGYARRLGGRFQYVLGVQRIIHPHEWQARDDALHWITQEYTSAIEAFVREAPEQYLWLHRRWRSRPAPQKRVRVATRGQVDGDSDRD